jgi:hypothetical protein
MANYQQSSSPGELKHCSLNDLTVAIAGLRLAIYSETAKPDWDDKCATLPDLAMELVSGRASVEGKGSQP